MTGSLNWRKSQTQITFPCWIWWTSEYSVYGKQKHLPNIPTKFSLPFSLLFFSSSSSSFNSFIQLINQPSQAQIPSRWLPLWVLRCTISAYNVTCIWFFKNAQYILQSFVHATLALKSKQQPNNTTVHLSTGRVVLALSPVSGNLCRMSLHCCF